MDSPKNIIKYIPRWLVCVTAVFFAVVLILFAIVWLFDKKYENKIYPGIFLNKINLGGRSPQETRDMLNQEADRFYQIGISFYIDGHRATIYPTVTSAEADLSYNIINFDIDGTADSAYAYGRGNDFLTNLRDKIKAIIYRRRMNLSFSADGAEIKKILEENFAQFEIPAQNARLTAEKGAIKIEEERLGKVIDYEKGIERLEANLAGLDNAPIQLYTKTDYPAISKKDCFNIEAEAEKILGRAPIILAYGSATSSDANNALISREWLINKNLLAQWLVLAVRQSGGGQKAAAALNRDEIKKYLEETVAAEINQEPINAKFEIKDGRVVEFQASKDGLALDIEDSLQKIEAAVAGNNSENNPENKIELPAKEVKSKVQAENINNIGIKEIIGAGESNFSGSPANRRHNIRTGAQSLNGVLIKPDEEFSLVETLGEIDAASGYLQELVIKGNKTVPEYGGGLCQIGTTIFRAALASGLPITMRRNHSYRVSYYEPAGTDATIYNPQPDLRFINDTGNYILIQYRIEGDNLYFDFWGTKDGRTVEVAKPTIYNIVKPGETKYIETLDLAPGKKKCTERAHSGADAYFDYEVTYAGGEIKEKRFSSHYVPWREVCLIGVEKLSTDEKKENDAAVDNNEAKEENKTTN